jgi:hypothetical protein
MTAWPAGLPQSLNIDGYGQAPDDGNVRTAMDAGPVHVRRRFSAVARRVAGYMVLTDAQFDDLMEFYDDDLAGGSLPFDWHPRGRHNASPAVVFSMRFTGPPTMRPIAGNRAYQVDMSFEILP